MGHINGIDAVGGEYDKTPEIHERVIEGEYRKLEPYLNVYSSRKAVDEMSEEDQAFHWTIAKWLQDNPESLEKYKAWFRKNFL